MKVRNLTVVINSLQAGLALAEPGDDAGLIKLAAVARQGADKVEALKTQIAEGKFKLNSQDVARRMLETLG